MSDDNQERHLPDVIDRASALEMEALDYTLRYVQSQCEQKRRPLPDGTYEDPDCEECGNEVGEARQRVAIMNHLCIHCATATERFRR